MTDLEILGIKLVCTSGACPEQYNAFYEGIQVGYFRLRHGSFTVECPDVLGEVVFSGLPYGDGYFEDNEREYWLSKGCLAVLSHLGRHPKDWKAYVLGLPQDSQLKMLMALLHWQIDELKGDSLRFMAAEDPDYQGTFTVNNQIYWTSSGNDILE